MNLTPQIEKAIKTAARLHKGQYRKVVGEDGEELPYVSHLYSVAWILAEYTDDEDVIIAGLLHDVLEDVKPSVYDEEDMKEEFGERVTRIVKEVSEDKDGTITKEEAEDTWQERKEGYLNGLEEDSKEGLMCSAADKLHNTRSLIEDYKKEREKVWDNFNASKEEKIWYYEEVLAVLEERLESEIVDVFKDAIGDLKRLSCEKDQWFVAVDFSGTGVRDRKGFESEEAAREYVLGLCNETCSTDYQFKPDKETICAACDTEWFVGTYEDWKGELSMKDINEEEN